MAKKPKTAVHEFTCSFRRLSPAPWSCPHWEFPDEGQIMGKIRPLASRVFNSLTPSPLRGPTHPTKLHFLETEGQGTQGGDWGPRSGWTDSCCPPGTDSVTSPDPGVLRQLSLSPNQPPSLPLSILALPRGTLSIPRSCLALPSYTAESLHHGSHPSLPLWHHPLSISSDSKMLRRNEPRLPPFP